MPYLETKILVYLACEAQITLLVVEKITILAKYLEFLNILSKKLDAKLLKRFDIKKYLIDQKPKK